MTNNSEIKPGDAFIGAINYLHSKDHAALVLVDHEGGETLIVERGKRSKCLKALLWRYLDERRPEFGCDADRVRIKTEIMLTKWLDEWSEENQ
jgi:hypothetical protein